MSPTLCITQGRTRFQVYSLRTDLLRWLKVWFVCLPVHHVDKLLTSFGLIVRNGILSDRKIEYRKKKIIKIKTKMTPGIEDHADVEVALSSRAPELAVGSDLASQACFEFIIIPPCLLAIPHVRSDTLPPLPPPHTDKYHLNLIYQKKTRPAQV